MSPETKTPESTTDTAYVEAVQKVQMQEGILAGGENIDQPRVDVLLSQKALENNGTIVEVNAAGAELLENLTADPSEEDSDVLVTAAAQRQLDIDSILALQEKAVRLDWPQDKYEEELAKIK